METKWQEIAMARAEEVNTDLGAQIAELRDTVAAEGEVNRTLVERCADMSNRIRALESPASAPDANERLWTKVIDRLNSAASPATAHQEPPEEKLYRALTATVLNDTMERCAEILNRKVEELMNGAEGDVDTLSQHDRLTSMAG